MAQRDVDKAVRQGFFEPHERAIIESAMARIIPTDDTPGAREAGTIDFLERYLSGIDHVRAKPDGSGFEQMEGKTADAWRERIDRLRRKYRDGIAELDRLSHAEFDNDFVELSDDQQDRVLAIVEDPAKRGATDPERPWAPSEHQADEPALQQTNAELELEFFPLLAFHTRQGFYADPIYGGNKNRVGWEVIGFPGPESLADVHSGRYSALSYFADPLGYPGRERHDDA